MSSISRQQMTDGRLVGQGQSAPRELEAHANGHRGRGDRARGPASHGAGELAPRLRQVAAVHRQPSGTGERQQARGVVPHPMLVDDGERSLEVPARVGPVAAVHGQQAELRLAHDVRIGIRAPSGGRVREGTPRLLSVAHEQQGFTANAERLIAPRAPGWLGFNREVRVSQGSLRTGGAHVRAQHGAGRRERGGAIQGHGFERRRVDEGGPPLRFGWLPFIANAQPARTARGGYCSTASAPTSASHRNTVLVRPDACVARTRALSRWAQRSRSPCGTGVRGRSPETRWLRTSRRPGDGAWGPLRFDTANLTEEELPEQRVVAVPLAAPIEGNEEVVHRFEPAQSFLCPWFTDTASHRGAKADPGPRCAGGTVDRHRGAVGATPGTGSPPRIGRHRRSPPLAATIARIIAAR